MLWILHTGATWKDLPEQHGVRSTCHRRFRQRVGSGTIERILRALAKVLEERGDLDLSDCLIAATFTLAIKGLAVGRTRRGKGNKIMAVEDQSCLSLAVNVAAASLAEFRLIAPVLERCFVATLPERLIGEKAYDSDRLDAELLAQGVEMFSPNRSGRRKSRDG